METTLINGDLTLGRHFTAGGSARVNDRLIVGGNLTVNGLLKARNIQGPCKGLFPSVEQLNSLYPDPAPGWWALVGKSLPALVFVADAGRWSSTGGSGGLEMPELTDCNLRLDRIDTLTDNITDRIDTLSDDLDVRLDTLSDELSGRISATESSVTDTTLRLGEIESQVLTRRPLDRAVCIHDPCGGRQTSPLFKRSNFSGFAHRAGYVEGAVDTLEIPVLAADWEGNTAPLTSLLLVMRRDDHQGQLIYSRLLSFSPVAPGESSLLTLSLGDTPVTLRDNVWIEFRFNAPCTLYINEGVSAVATDCPSGRYYIAGRQELTDPGHLPEPPRPWQFIQYRLLYAGGAELTLSDNVVRDIGTRLEKSGLIPGASSGPATDPGSSDPQLDHLSSHLPGVRMPPRFYAVEGDTLQLFYRGMIRDTLVAIHRPMLQADRGMALPRYWEYTPPAGSAGECVLKMTLRDASGENMVSAESVLTTVPVPASPDAPLHVVCIGDSLTAPGTWPREVYRRLCSTGGTPEGLGLTGILFCGDRQNGGVGWTGYGGWRWASYLGEGVRGGTGAGEVTLTANPLYDPAIGKPSFGYFASEYCGGRIHVVYAMLGWNELSSTGRDLSRVMDDVRTFARLLHLDFPQARLRLAGIPMPSVCGGMGISYGAAGGSYADTRDMTLMAHRLNALYADMASEPEFAPYVSYVETAAQVDTDYVMPTAERPVNTRSTLTETIGTNGVHPSPGGYMQIADAIYRDLCALLGGVDR